MGIRGFVSCVLGLTTTLMLVALGQNAAAQGFPSRPITVLFPYSGGTVIEQVYRAMNAEASKLLGQQVLLETRAGANGRLGVTALKNAPPDGYMMAVATDSILVTQPLADPDFKLALGKDYVPVGMQLDFPIVLFGNPALPFRDLKGLITYAKANPGKLNFAHTPATVVTLEMLRQLAGIAFTMIPYKGTEYFLDMIAGRVDVSTGGATGLPFVSSGKIVALATSGKQRWAIFPDAPTFTESGVPMVYAVWFGIVAPPGTPADVAARMSNAYAATIKLPAIQKIFETSGYLPSTYTTPKEFSEFIRSEINAQGPVIRKSGIKLQ